MARAALALAITLSALFLVACVGGDPASPGLFADAGSDGAVLPPPPPPGSGGSLPCDVDAVLAQNCRSCHASPPRFGAPMPLMTYADTQAPAKSDATQLVWQMMQKRVHATSAPMPPTGPLDAASLATLDAWFAAGAPAGSGSCGDAGAPPDAGAVGPQFLPCTPSQTFTAHAPGSTTGFQVPETGADNLYECFSFKSPFSGTPEGTAWAPIIGDSRVLHHWILYRTATPQVDGAVGPCNMPNDSTFIAGWAPGGTNYVLPSDIGLEMGGPNDYFILQVHYHNIAHYSDAVDSSGVAFCTTDTPRLHEAGVYTLGTVNINIPPHAQGYSTSGTCASWETAYLPQPVTIISTFPHMHTLGQSIQVDVHRGSDTGPLETLVDVPSWNFENQISYSSSPPFVFNPGDSVTTTCTYNNPGDTAVTFGEATENEMCFAFLLLYPINIFQSGSRSCGLL